MAAFGDKVRSWRRKAKRGVSPIIATILLVAITVVLAAVLYILISGLTGGSSSVPLGTAYALNSPQENSKGTNNYANFSIEAAGNSILANNLLFQVKSTGGTIIGLAAGSVVNLIGFSGSILATYSFATQTWTSGGTTPLQAGEIMSLTTTTTIFASGYLFVSIGQGHFAGTVPTAIT